MSNTRHIVLLRKLGPSLGLALACLAGIASTEAKAADTLARIRETQTIRLAYRETALPFSYLDENKKPVGFAIDLCQRIVESIRRDQKLKQIAIEYVPVTSASRIAAITEGRADLECASTTNTAERRKQVAFTIPHFVASVRMIVRNNSRIANWTDLRGKRVVAVKGTTTVQLLTERDKVRAIGVNLVETADSAEAFSRVENGDADAFPFDDVLLFGFRANAKNPNSFLIVGDSLSSEPYAIMLRKDDAAFKAAVDREMSQLMHDGEFARLYDKWFRQPIPPKRVNLNMPMGYLLRDLLRFPTDRVGSGQEEARK